MQIEKENALIDAIINLDNTAGAVEKKLLLGARRGNRVDVYAELRCMATVGGQQYALAEINFMNQRHSAIYEHDALEIAEKAINLQKRYYVGCEWFTHADCEHTVETQYLDVEAV